MGGSDPRRKRVEKRISEMAFSSRLFIKIGD